MMNKLIFLTTVAVVATSAQAAEQYDREMLAELGFDAGISELLNKGTGFLPGNHPISIIINGQNKGISNINFDASGAACWNEVLLRKLGIDPRSFTQSSPTCMKPADGSDIRIESEVDRNTLVIYAPVENLLTATHYETGGNAVILNYDARRYQYQGSTTQTSQTMTSELGANISQWIIRSGQSYSSYGSETNFNRLYTYAQRSIPGWSSVMQIGEITSGDAIFSGISMTGAQMIPERQSQNGGANAVVLDVLVSQAGTLEVWQGDVLLKTFSVTSGMNTLSGIPAINQQDDFVIISHDNTGSRQKQYIPYIQARPVTTLSDTGTSLAAGRLRLSDDNFSLVMGSTGIYRSSWLALVAGGLLSEEYQSGAWRATVRITEYLRMTLSQTYSFAQTNDGNKQGVNQQATLRMPLTERLSVQASANYRSRDYITPTSSAASKKTALETGQIKTQYAAGFSYATPLLGAFTFTGSSSHTWTGSETLGYALSWGRAFGKVNMNVGIQKNRLSDDSRHYDSRYTYVNFSVPLGTSQNLRGWVNDKGNRTLVGAGYDQTVNDKFSWSLSSEKAQQESASLASSATWTNKYTQISGGASHSEYNRSYNVGARGGAVLHGSGLTFTPRTVGDTFSIISLNSDRSDVKLRTPGGTVWTDHSGKAIASWTPWQKNTVAVDLASLPKNVQIPGGVIDVTPYRGAVVPVTMPAFTVRRTLLTFPAGEGPAPGSAVKNKNGTLVAFVNDDGTLFFDDLPEGNISAQLSSGRQCTIQLASPWVSQPGTLYASLDARCVL